MGSTGVLRAGGKDADGAKKRVSLRFPLRRGDVGLPDRGPRTGRRRQHPLGHLRRHPRQRRARRGRPRRVRPLPPLRGRLRSAGGRAFRRLPLLDKLGAGHARGARRAEPRGARLLRPAGGRDAGARAQAGRDTLPLGAALAACRPRRLAQPRHGGLVRRLHRDHHGPHRRPRLVGRPDQRVLVRCLALALPRRPRAGPARHPRHRPRHAPRPAGPRPLDRGDAGARHVQPRRGLQSRMGRTGRRQRRRARGRRALRRLLQPLLRVWHLQGQLPASRARRLRRRTCPRAGRTTWPRSASRSTGSGSTTTPAS